MDRDLQIILLIGSLIFFIFIINMIRTKKFELKYALTWILASSSFILLSIFPGILRGISGILYIKEPVNTLFLIVMFFLILIIFTLTVSFSASVWRIKTLTQEIGILKLKIEELEKEKRKIIDN